jgi:hypothetical protein
MSCSFISYRKLLTKELRLVIANPVRDNTHSQVAAARSKSLCFYGKTFKTKNSGHSPNKFLIATIILSSSSSVGAAWPEVPKKFNLLNFFIYFSKVPNV